MHGTVNMYIAIIIKRKEEKRLATYTDMYMDAGTFRGSTKSTIDWSDRFA